MNEDKKIEKMIRESLREEKPSADFKNKIMDQIAAIDEKEEKALTSLLKRNIMESPSMSFTSRVMAEVEKTSIQVVNAPIISKKAWMFITVFISSIFVFVLFTGEKNDAATQKIDGTFEKMDHMLSNSLTFDMPAILTSPLFGLSVFALSSLLFLDYYMSNRRMSLKV